MRTTLLGGASRFAHFAGLGGRRRGARADGDEDRRDDTDGRRSRRADEDEDREGDQEGRRSSRADEGDDRDDREEGRRGSRADEGDDDRDEGQARRGSRADGDDDDRQDARGGRRSGRTEEDDQDAAEEDDDEKEARGNSASARAWRKSQARCAAIFAHPQAAADPELASILAFETTMPRSAAIARLNKAAGSARAAPRGADRASRYAEGRSDRNPQSVDGGQAAPGASKQATAAGWDRSMSKAAGRLAAGSAGR